MSRDAIYAPVTKGKTGPVTRAGFPSISSQRIRKSLNTKDISYKERTYKERHKFESVFNGEFSFKKDIVRLKRQKSS